MFVGRGCDSSTRAVSNIHRVVGNDFLRAGCCSPGSVRCSIVGGPSGRDRNMGVCGSTNSATRLLSDLLRNASVAVARAGRSVGNTLGPSTGRPCG